MFCRPPILLSRAPVSCCIFKMDVNVEDILHTLTLEEKVSLLAGKNFWETVPVLAKGVPAIKVCEIDCLVKMECSDLLGF